MRIRTYCIIFLFAALQMACRKGKATWDSEYSVPLANASLGLSEIIPDTLINTNSDHSLELNVDQEFYRFSLDKLVQVRDTTIVSKFNFPFGQFTLQPGTQFLAQVNETKFNFGDVSLSMIRIRSGSVKVRMKSRIKERTRVKYRIPAASKDGAAFEANFEVPAATTSSVSVIETSFDLSGYEFNLRGINQDQYNVLHNTVDAWVHEDGNEVIIAAADTILVENTFVSLQPDYGRGYFGSGEYDIPLTTTNFDFFRNIPSGVLDLRSATAELILENGIGADARARIKTLKGIKGSQSVVLTNSTLSNTINLNRATEVPKVDTKWTLLLNESNSNIVDLVELLPSSIAYEIDLTINPLGNTSGANDFIDADRPFTARMNLKIPLDLSLDQFVLDDTVSFSYTETEQSARLKKGTIHVFTENGFPFDAKIQLYMLNESGELLDSVFTSANTIVSGRLDTQLKVSEPGKSHLQADLPESKVDMVPQTKKLRIRAILNTAGNPSRVKIYDTYRLGVKASAEFTYEDRW